MVPKSETRKDKPMTTMPRTQAKISNKIGKETRNPG